MPSSHTPPGSEAQALARKVADQIEHLPWRPIEGATVADGVEIDAFTMKSTHFSECGSPACIVGWTIHLAGRKAGDNPHYEVIGEQAARLLGLKPSQRDHLFAPLIEDGDGVEFTASPGEEGWISGAEAAWTLRHYADTGEVVWRIADSKELDEVHG